MMNQLDANEINKSTLDFFRVKCSHRRIDIAEADLIDLSKVLDNLLDKHVDNTQLTGDYNV